MFAFKKTFSYSSIVRAKGEANINLMNENEKTCTLLENVKRYFLVCGKNYEFGRNVSFAFAPNGIQVITFTFQLILIFPSPSLRQKQKFNQQP